MLRKLVHLSCASCSVVGHLGTTDACDPHSNIFADSVFVQGEAGFDGARMDQYAKYSGTTLDANATLNPGMVVYCTDEAHVQSAIRFAVACSYKVTMRSGGHSYSGASSCSNDRCMQLDLSGMNTMSVDGHAITVGPGVKLGEFAAFTLKHHLSVPHGGCDKVAMGGHLQSSAWGMMSHSHGSGMDHVESFRMILANGSLVEASRRDTNSTLYKSVLGSAPGSWGVITQYTLNGVHDMEVPLTRVIMIRILYSKENFKKAFLQTQFIHKDQEEKNLRDIKVILVVAPDTEFVENTPYITMYALWTGIDSGAMTAKWRNAYLQPFWDLDHSAFPWSADLPMTLSAATGSFVSQWTNHDDRYAVEAFHSDRWWDDGEFIEMLATEIDDRVAMIPDAYPSWQFLPLGTNSQWSRNAGMNSLTWRDTRAYVDDWMFFKSDAHYEEIVTRMRNFRERTRRFWQHTDGSDRSTWMSPMTIYPNATDLRNKTIAQQFFPNITQFRQLQLMKAELDPQDLFSNKGTIPLPERMLLV